VVLNVALVISSSPLLYSFDLPMSHMYLDAMHLPPPACRHLWKFIQVGTYRAPSVSLKKI